MHIGDREIVVGENQADEQGLPYLVAYYESNAILGRYYDAIGSDDFTEIMEIYGQRVMEQAQKTRVELSTPKVQGIDNSPITAERCKPISYDDDLNGKVIVIKPEVLRRVPESYQPGQTMYGQLPEQIPIAVGQQSYAQGLHWPSEPL